MSHSLLASDHHHSDADVEDHDSVLGTIGTRAQRPKARSQHPRPSIDGVEEAAPKAKAPKVRRKKPKPSQARKAAKSTGGGSKRRQANAVTSPDTDSFLQFVGAECEWTDALLALGTKELNDVLRKGNYTPAQIQDLKSSRRRAKNRTYALRSRQKKGGKEQAPCPGGPESAQEVFEAAADAAASAARSSTRRSAKQESQPGGGAAVADSGPAATTPAAAGAETADTAGPAVDAGTRFGEVGLGGVGLTSEYAHKMLLAESDEDDESLELLQFLAEGQARTGAGYADYADPASDTGSHTDTSNSGWGSSSYTDSYSESYSESNDAFDSEYDSVESMDLAPDFEMSGLSLSDPVAPVVSPMTPVKQQQQPQPEPPLDLDQPPSLNLGQPNELEAMVADLRSNYSAVHRKLDKFAVGLPSAGDGGRHSRSTTPTPGDDPATAIPLSLAADPLFVDLKSGFQTLNAKMDSWLNHDGVGAAASTPTLPSQSTVFDYGAPVMEIEPRDRVYSMGGSSYDHFMAGMMGGSSGVPPI